MPTERIAMRHAREVIRLKFSLLLPVREIGRRLELAPSTVRETLKRMEGAGLFWPLPAGLKDAELEDRLYENRRSKRGHRNHEVPDWSTVNLELKKKYVTLMTVWEEYHDLNPDGYSYSRFCALYNAFVARMAPTMRQTYTAGERLFVDYAGDGVPVVIDPRKGEAGIRKAQIFVAVLGASSFIFAHATWTQTLPDWIDAHVRALEAIGGVPELIVPDNTKTAIVKASLYEPEVNRTYVEMADHYGTAVLPARPRKPRDKPKVERAVLIVERWLLGRLRNRVFHSLAEVNAAIAEMTIELNDVRTIRRLGVTRRQLLETVDGPALKPLPVDPYEFSEWRKRRVGPDYHVEVRDHYYSVPHRHARSEVDVRITVGTVEVFLRGERIAVHVRDDVKHKHTTVPEHMPANHRRYAEWSLSRIREEALRVGPRTATLCEEILEARPHHEQAYRSCYGIVRLVKSYGPERVEAACQRALSGGARTYTSVKSILDKNLDRLPSTAPATEAKPILHENIRGPGYYH